MNTKNFTPSDLKEFYESEKVIFLNYRRVYELVRSENNGFKFIEDKSNYVRTGLPHTKSGRFHNFKKDNKTLLSILN